MKIYVLIFFLSAILCTSGNLQQVTNWGPTTCGSQLSISLTNSALTAGSNSTLIARIKNSSSNVLAIVISYEPLEDFAVSLTGKDGDEHRLKSELTGPRITNLSWRDIGPGETYERFITLPVSKHLEAGTYTLRAIKGVSIRSNARLAPCADNPLRSNAVDVRLESR